MKPENPSRDVVQDRLFDDVSPLSSEAISKGAILLVSGENTPAVNRACFMVTHTGNETDELRGSVGDFRLANSLHNDFSVFQIEAVSDAKSTERALRHLHGLSHNLLGPKFLLAVHRDNVYIGSYSKSLRDAKANRVPLDAFQIMPLADGKIEHMVALGRNIYLKEKVRSDFLSHAAVGGLVGFLIHPIASLALAGVSGAAGVNRDDVGRISSVIDNKARIADVAQRIHEALIVSVDPGKLKNALKTL